MSVSYIPELFAINDTLARQWQALRAAGRNELAAEVMAAGAAISKLMGKIVKAERNVFSSGGSSTGEQPGLKASAVAGSTPAPCSEVVLAERELQIQRDYDRSVEEEHAEEMERC